MSAYHTSAPAHETTAGGRSTHINVDKTGVSMSWKTAVGVISAIIAGMITWNAFSETLVHAVDLRSHDKNLDAHVVEDSRGQPSRVVHQHELHEMIEPLKQEISSNREIVLTLQTGFFDQRAEDLAYRAVEKLPRKAGDQERIREFERVRRKAKANLRAGRDIREGIDAPTF